MGRFLHGRIPDHAAVCMHSGWERRVHDPVGYRNPGPDGRLHFPGFGLNAVEWLLEKCRIVALGVDTLSLDVGASTLGGGLGRALPRPGPLVSVPEREVPPGCGDVLMPLRT